MEQSKYPRFPLFISLEERPVLVVGGGAIAARRIGALLEFGAKITVAAPEICPALEVLTERITWLKQEYQGLDRPYTLVIAATNRREVNRKVGEDAAYAEIPVSVADRREESTFWFPAIVRTGKLVTGLVSTDGDHAAVKEAAGKLRREWEDAR